MEVGDIVITPYGEYGTIIAREGDLWVIENGEDDDVIEKFPEQHLTLLRKGTDNARNS